MHMHAYVVYDFIQVVRESAWLMAQNFELQAALHTSHRRERPRHDASTTKIESMAASSNSALQASVLIKHVPSSAAVLHVLL
jgi:hypothetical protein